MLLRSSCLLFLACIGSFSTSAAFARDESNPDAVYSLSSESQRQANVPQGKVVSGVWESEVFPGTRRAYSVYIPAQYTGAEPACLMVFQDGHAYVDADGQFRVPVVLDNLIHRGELPIIIGLFVNPGHAAETLPENPWRSSNRSFEYDTLSDQYARFLQHELVPHITSDLSLNLSMNPEDRAICGISSGGICAFTAAWERPEWFRKVVSHVGSFTNIRGGHVYPALIRKADERPLRVFLQDGSNDLDNRHGNWWLSNLQMDKALAFRGYDYQFVGGQGGHNGIHGGVILPDTLRWLWRDHVTGVPQPGDEEDAAAPAAEAYEERAVRYSGGEYDEEEFRYRLLKPQTVVDQQKYPLVIFLHGAGERGDDNIAQLTYFPAMMATPAYQDRFPCYVLAPQCRKEKKWADVDWSSPDNPAMTDSPSHQMQVVLQAIKKTLAEEQIDASRIYLTGLSMGGYGSWDLGIRHPEMFAAVAPVCGGVDETKVAPLANKPVWVVHGDQDRAVPVERSRRPVQALRDAGGQPIYVELPGVGHDSWKTAYRQPSGLVPWLFRQKLSN